MARYFRYAAWAAALLSGLLMAGPAQGYANTPPIAASYNNRVIDDSIFLDSGSMTVQQIQDFLNSKVPSCDTNHQGGLAQYPPPYTCLRDYIDPTTNKSAAQLIYDESTSIGLNPQVVLVTLEKEQGLISDTWPYPSQYRSAMGYGCPESQSVCDSQYYGFYNQVHLGARLLRAGEARDCGDTQTLSSWSINGKWGIGNSPVVDGKSTYLASCSTGSLYNYTPHRPDSAYTLASDGNYYYGNYNFIKYWTSWFGPTVRAYLGRGTSSPQVYLINDTDKYPINNLDILNTYMTYGPVQTFNDGFIASLNPRSVLGRWIVDSHGTVYLLDSGNKIPFGNCSLVSDYGADCSWVTSLPQNVVDGFIAGPGATNVARTTNGSIYKLQAGKKRAVPDMATYTGSGLSSVGATGLSDTYVGGFGLGAPILLDQVVVQNRDDGSCYLFINGAIRPAGYVAYLNWKLTSRPFYRFSSLEVGQLTVGALITTYAQDSGGTKYLLDLGQKLPLGGGASQWNSSFTQLNDTLLNAIPTGSAPSRAIHGSGPSIWYMDNGQKRPFAGWLGFVGSGFNSVGDATPVDDDTIAAMPVGPLKMGSLQLMKQAGDASVALVDGNGAKLLSSPQMAAAYGLGLDNVYTVDGATWNLYAPSGTLGQLESDGTNDFLVDGGNKRAFSGSMLSVYGYTAGNFQSMQTNTMGKLSTASDMTAFVKGSGGTIYHVESGTKRPFASWGGYQSAGGTGSNTITLSDFYLSSLPTGALLP
jgi:hypothetical protein